MRGHYPTKLPVAIVNVAFVRKHYGIESALGLSLALTLATVG